MSKQGFFSKRVSKLTDYSKDVVGYDYLKEQNKELLNTAENIFNVSKMIKGSKKETFQMAKKRLGLSEMDLMNRYNTMSKLFYTNLVISFLLLFLIFYLLFIGGVLQAIVTLTIMGISLANCFKFSFRCFQIKIRNLCQVNLWIKEKGFFPVFNISGTMKIRDDEEDNLEPELEVLSEEEKEKINKAIEKEKDDYLKEYENKLQKENQEYERKLQKEKEDAKLFMKKLLMKAEAEKQIILNDKPASNEKEMGA